MKGVPYARKVFRVWAKYVNVDQAWEAANYQSRNEARAFALAFIVAAFEDLEIAPLERVWIVDRHGVVLSTFGPFNNSPFMELGTADV